MENTDQILKSFRKKPLFELGDLSTQVNFGEEEIKRLIPHRSPLLYIDGISGYDYESGRIAGYRKIDPKDPILQGHFPDYPVYPGNFMVESIGQLGLCLYYFVTQKTNVLGADAKPVALRATKIAGALFLEPVLPGDHVVLLGKVLEFDGYFATLVGQAIVNGKVAVVCIGEVLVITD